MYMGWTTHLWKNDVKLVYCKSSYECKCCQVLIWIFLNSRISSADCVILGTDDKPLVECHVVPWYKHKMLETTFVSVENVVENDASQQEVDVELDEEAANDGVVGDQVI